MGIDIIGPLPKSRNGKRYIITCIDHFSRFLETHATTKKSSREVAKFLIEKIFNRYGNPTTLLSDQGKEF